MQRRGCEAPGSMWVSVGLDVGGCHLSSCLRRDGVGGHYLRDGVWPTDVSELGLVVLVEGCFCPGRVLRPSRAVVGVKEPPAVKKGSRTHCRSLTRGLHASRGQGS